MKKKDHNRIDEALAILEEAAREKRDELRERINERYNNVKEVLLEGNSQRIDSMKHRMHDALRDGEQRLEDLLRQGGSSARRTLRDLDKEVRDNPWPFVGAVALSAVIFGVLFGHRGDEKR